MRNTNKIIALFLIASSLSAIAADDIGNFWRAKKTTVDSQAATKGQGFQLNQLIETGKSPIAKAEIATIDDSRYILYKNSSIKFEDLKLSGGKCEGLKVTLNQGKLRGTSGKCGHGKTEIVTTVASAFSWGTDYEMVYISENNKSEEFKNTPTGFYQKVNEGKVLVKNQVGSLLVNPGEVGFVASLTDIPVVIEMPAFFSNSEKSKSKPRSKTKSYTPIADSEDDVVDVTSITTEPNTIEDQPIPEVEIIEEDLSADSNLLSASTYSASIEEGYDTSARQILNSITGTGAGDSTITYTLSGDDANKFSVDSNGVVSVAAHTNLDYESMFNNITRAAPTYNISVSASDGTNTDTADIAVTITDRRDSQYANSTSLWLEASPSAHYDFVNVVTPFTSGITAQGSLISYNNNNETVTFSGGNNDGTLTHSSHANDESGSLSINNGASTVYWGYWHDATKLVTSTNPNLTYTGSSWNITEVKANEHLNLPSTGTLNYGIAAKSPVLLDSNDGSTKGTLTTATLSINFATDAVTGQFTINDGSQTVVSNSIGATLLDTGRFYGKTGDWDHVDIANPGPTSTEIAKEIADVSNTNLDQGDAFMAGSVMGNSGSHVGVVYGVALSSTDLPDGTPNSGTGVVLFEATSAQ